MIFINIIPSRYYLVVMARIAPEILISICVNCINSIFIVVSMLQKLTINMEKNIHINIQHCNVSATFYV